jgi:hypothetical protein
MMSESPWQKKKKKKGEEGERCDSKAWVRRNGLEIRKSWNEVEGRHADYNRWRDEERRAVLSVGVRAGSGSERDDERKRSPLYH